MPKVSVITPVYNAEDYIEEVIGSVCQSNYKNLEYIIVNDGSFDNSESKIKKAIGSTDRNVEFINTTNSGEANAVNRAFAKSSGEFVMIVNADDPIKPGLIPESVKKFKSNNKLAVVYPDWDWIDSNNKIIKSVVVPEFSMDRLVGNFWCLPGPGTMFRKSALKNKLPRDPRYKYLSDFELWLRLSLEGEFERLPESLATWRDLSSNLSNSNKGEKRANELILLQKEFFENHNLPSSIKKMEKRSRSYANYHAATEGLSNSEVPFFKFFFRSLTSLYIPRFYRQPIRRKLFLILVGKMLILIKNCKKKIKIVKTMLISSSCILELNDLILLVD